MRIRKSDKNRLGQKIETKKNNFYHTSCSDAPLYSIHESLLILDKQACELRNLDLPAQALLAVASIFPPFFWFIFCKRPRSCVTFSWLRDYGSIEFSIIWLFPSLVLKALLAITPFLLPFVLSEFKIWRETMKFIALINVMSCFLTIVEYYNVFLRKISLLCLILIKTPRPSLHYKPEKMLIPMGSWEKHEFLSTSHLELLMNMLDQCGVQEDNKM